MKIYFEAGANDGVFQSRTLKYKDDPEWEGFLFEPDPRCIEDLKRNRNNDRTHIYNMALISGEDPDLKYVKFNLHNHSAMNSVDGTNARNEKFGEQIEVKCISASRLLQYNQCYQFDELYLDVEGYEVEVLKGFHPGWTCIMWAEIELHSHDTCRADEERESIIAEMTRLGLELIDTNTNEGHPKLIFSRPTPQ